MIIVKISGGLGNQLFQYAAAKSLSERTGKKLYIDIGHYDKYSDRKFKLKDIYNIKDDVIEISKIPIDYKIYNNRIVNYLFRKLKINIEIKNKYLCQYNFDIDKRLQYQYKGNIYLNGYWQNESYFKENEEIIRENITLKEKLNKDIVNLIEDIEVSNSVSVHIRRGDYMNEKNIKIYGVCSIKYYENAIKVMASNIKNPKFFFFSDDIEWVKNNINIDYEKVFIDAGYKDYEELYMMSKCKHNIIANSSFSWWGAWLNTNKDKKIIAPKKWTNKLTKTNQIIPNNWEVI